MMRLVGMFVVLVMSLVIVAGAPGANGRASCNGVLVSSLAGQPGAVAEGTREFHQQFKDAGIPPGFFDVAGAHAHSGGVLECLADLGA
jgi:hypothetical protein